jgi:hypothetical protein
MKGIRREMGRGSGKDEIVEGVSRKRRRRI